MSYIKNNAEDRSQSMTRVASSFSGTYHVSTFLWDTITTRQVHEYADGDMDDGYIVNETIKPENGHPGLVPEIQDSVRNLCELQRRYLEFRKRCVRGRPAEDHQCACPEIAWPDGRFRSREALHGSPIE